MNTPLVQIGQGDSTTCIYGLRGGRLIIVGPPHDTLTHGEAIRLCNADGDTAELHARLATIPFRETAKPDNARQCPAVGLWTWTLAWCGVGLIVGATLFALAIRLGLIEVTR